MCNIQIAQNFCERSIFMQLFMIPYHAKNGEQKLHNQTKLRLFIFWKSEIKTILQVYEDI